VSLRITIMIHSAGTAAAEGGIAVRVFSLLAEHVIYEMLAWFNKYVQIAPPRGAGTADLAR
jgi:hypothetical protein